MGPEYGHGSDGYRFRTTLCVSETVPDSIRPLLGNYELPTGQGALTLTWEDKAITVTDPAGRVTPLTEASTPGTWVTDERQPKRITFTLDAEGNAAAMKLTEIVDLPRLGPGA